MKTQLLVKNLLACLEVAPKKDTRYSLIGVHLDYCNELEMVYVATGGSVLIAIRAPNPCFEDIGAETPPKSLTIPRQVLADTLKGYKREFIQLETMPDGRYMLGEQAIFTPVDAKYPDYKRAIPSTVSGEAGNYNPELYARAFKAVSIASFKGSVYIVQDGESGSAVVLANNQPEIVCVLMSCRARDVEFTYNGWRKPSTIQGNEAVTI